MADATQTSTDWETECHSEVFFAFVCRCTATYLQTAELRAALVGHIARTLTVFGVDEVVVYEDVGEPNAPGRQREVRQAGRRGLAVFDLPRGFMLRSFGVKL